MPLTNLLLKFLLFLFVAELLSWTEKGEKLGSSHSEQVVAIQSTVCGFNSLQNINVNKKY